VAAAYFAKFAVAAVSSARTAAAEAVCFDLEDDLVAMLVFNVLF
jgi:hypothetical protein